MLAEVGLRRCLYAVGEAAEVNRVEVVREDPRLGLHLRQLDGVDDLLELLLVRQVAPGRLEVRFDVLFGDRRSALTAASGEVDEERAGGAGQRDAAFGEEVPVLGGEEGLLQVLALAELRRRQDRAIIAAETTELGLPFGEIDHGRRGKGAAQY